MTMLPVIALLAGLGVAADPPADAARADQQRLQGDWQVVTQEADGMKGPDEVARRMRYRFAGDRLIISPAEPGSDSELTCRLDPAKMPKAIDMTVRTGPNKGKAYAGIYVLDGDGLKICFAKADRPAAFATRANSGTALIVLKRVKP
jgi:uncharacterized protein (TIGR03067 family)